MTEIVSVACVMRSGGVYDAEWVRKLRNGVRRHLSLPHRFVCLTDRSADIERAGIEAIPLIADWPGWWSKLNLFAPGTLTGRVVYFDLDSMVVGSLDRIASYPHRFTMAHDWFAGHPCSTAMAWEGDYAFLFDEFAKDPAGISSRYDKMLRAEKRIGDQAFIEDVLLNAGHEIELFRDVTGDKSIASYKKDGCAQAPCPGASVVAFHGRPKPPDIKNGWVAHTWK